jgi:hypothetical protein
VFQVRSLLKRRSDRTRAPTLRCQVMNMVVEMMANMKPSASAARKFELLVTTSGLNRAARKYGRASEMCAGMQRYEVDGWVICRNSCGVDAASRVDAACCAP